MTILLATPARWYLIFAFTLLSIAGCSGGSSQSREGNDPFATPTPRPAPAPADPARSIHTDITSTITGITYPLHIYLPRNYDDTTAYPVVYATDGQWIFNGFAEILDNQPHDILLVAVEQGPNDRRATDYTIPGSESYYQFLITELLPAIESQYTVDEQQRTLAGASYGGLLVGAVLLFDDVSQPHFKNYLAFDGSFYYDQTTLARYEQERFNASADMPVNLFLSTATLQGNFTSVNWFRQRLQSRSYSGLNILYREYTVVHDEVANPSFEEAISLLYP